MMGNATARQIGAPKELLERGPELALLRDSLGEAAARRGSIDRLSGAAGSGKSRVLRAWLDGPGQEAQLLVGWCDDFLTRRTLGPLHDVARTVGGALAEAIGSADTGAVFEALLDHLDDPLRPTALALEDLQWADETTLDVVRYVGRRIERRPAMLVLSYRDDDLDDDHPLWGSAPRSRSPPVSPTTSASSTASSNSTPTLSRSCITRPPRPELTSSRPMGRAPRRSPTRPAPTARRHPTRPTPSGSRNGWDLRCAASSSSSGRGRSTTCTGSRRRRKLHRRRSLCTRSSSSPSPAPAR